MIWFWTSWNKKLWSNRFRLQIELFSTYSFWYDIDPHCQTVLPLHCFHPSLLFQLHVPTLLGMFGAPQWLICLMQGQSAPNPNALVAMISLNLDWGSQNADKVSCPRGGSKQWTILNGNTGGSSGGSVKFLTSNCFILKWISPALVSDWQNTTTLKGFRSHSNNYPCKQGAKLYHWFVVLDYIFNVRMVWCHTNHILCSLCTKVP